MGKSVQLDQMEDLEQDNIMSGSRWIMVWIHERMKRGVYNKGGYYFTFYTIINYTAK